MFTTPSCLRFNTKTSLKLSQTPFLRLRHEAHLQIHGPHRPLDQRQPPVWPRQARIHAPSTCSPAYAAWRGITSHHWVCARQMVLQKGYARPPGTWTRRQKALRCFRLVVEAPLSRRRSRARPAPGPPWRLDRAAVRLPPPWDPARSTLVARWVRKAAVAARRMWAAAWAAAWASSPVHGFLFREFRGPL